MSTHWGVEGIVKVGAAAVAEVDSWSIQESVSPVVDTAMGDTSETHIPGSGIKSWSGSLSCHWDETDTLGQEALTIGASVTLNLYPEGDASTDKEYTGLASITDVTLDLTKDGMTTRNFTFQGNGALTIGAVI